MLGGRAESSSRQAMVGSQGDLATFFSNGPVGTITGLSILILFCSLISGLFSSLTKQRKAVRA